MLARLLAAAVLFAISGNAQFEIRGSRLFLDGSPFTVRGVAYSPTPIGQISPALLSYSGCLYARDLPLMARAGINTVRVYGRIPPDERAFWQILESSCLYLLAGFPLEPYYDSRATLSPSASEGRALRARILADLQDYAAQLRDRRRVMAIIFGNEVGANYNAKFAGAPRDFYSLVEEATGVWRAAVGASGPLLTTAVADVSDIGQAALSTRDSDLADLAFWSVNGVRAA